MEKSAYSKEHSKSRTKTNSFRANLQGVLYEGSYLGVSLKYTRFYYEEDGTTMAPKSFKAVDAKGSAQVSGHSKGATQVKNVSQISGKKIQSFSLNDVNNTKIKEKMVELVKEGLEKQNRNRLELKLKKSGSAQIPVLGRNINSSSTLNTVSSGEHSLRNSRKLSVISSQDETTTPLSLPSGVVVSPSVQVKPYTNSSQNQNINPMKINVNSDMGGGGMGIAPKIGKLKMNSYTISMTVLAEKTSYPRL